MERREDHPQPRDQSALAGKGTPVRDGPSSSLPKGGGAIHSIGEKFGVNPINGSGSFTVPIPTSPGRTGFGPQLSLSYDSGTGNGPFGLGWSLDLPTITRATEKGLPRYLDDDESDEFIFSGAESLVPVLNADGEIVRRPIALHDIAYSVITYRPRIEGLFARIERWVNTETGISHWRSITGDNVATLYGLDSASQIVDSSAADRVFSWLIDRTFDDKGNLIVYRHVPENSAEVDFGLAHESHRANLTTFPQRYLKQIDYAATSPWYADWSHTGNQTPLPEGWYFSLVLDYGDHTSDIPTPTPDQIWPTRPDPFSTYASGFEIRTWRRCNRALMFHHFANEPEVGTDCLVHTLDLHYADEVQPPDLRYPLYSLLHSVEQVAYRRLDNGYRHHAAPPLEFTYSEARVQADVRKFDPESAENLPEGVDGERYQLVDLDGDGLPGILNIQSGNWTYKRNLGPLPNPAHPDRPTARFGAANSVSTLPSQIAMSGAPRLLDLAGDGRLDVVVLEHPTPGFSERTMDRNFDPLRPFQSLPDIDWADANLRFVDLSGDGLADVLITGDTVWTVYASLGEAGFAQAHQIAAPWDEQSGPKVVFADGTESLHLADMSGDGASDIVRIRNGTTNYWPNVGYGRFGPMVTMDGAHRFVDDERYDPRRVRLADIDGSGTTDLIYISEQGVFACFNQSGNRWAEAHLLAIFPTADDLSTVQVADLMGNGTACLIWSSPLVEPGKPASMYVDLLGGQKPHLMTSSRNNMGAETRLTYAPSTRFYLEDEAAGQPWLTRLPFPVHVVQRVETYDWIGRSRFVSSYAYHHGYFDGHEREFRGFGMIEKWDTEDYRVDASFQDSSATNWAEASWIPPIHTKTWIHTGAFDEANAISRQYESEYWVEPALRSADRQADRAAMTLPDTVLPDNLGQDDLREAHRALKGTTLRTEIYADDLSGAHGHPYSVVEQNVSLRCIQGRRRTKHAVFLVLPRESITFNYEQKPEDPRVSHAMTLESDEWGNVVRGVAIGYPRRIGHPALEPDLSPAFQTMLAYDQARLDVAATRNVFTRSIADSAEFPNVYRLPLPAESIAAELPGLAPAANRSGVTNLFTFEEMAGFWTQAWTPANAIPYEDVSSADVDGSGPAASTGHRIIQRSRVRYRRDDLSGFLAFGDLQAGAIPGESFDLALTPRLVSRIFGNRVTDSILTEAGYVHLDGDSDWWVPSGRTFFSPNPAVTPAQELVEARGHFYLTRRMVDPFGAMSSGTFAYDLMANQTTDSLGNTVTSEFDFRVLQPKRVTDPNGNRVEAAFDIHGLVTANAVRGKVTETLGDELTGFSSDLDDVDLQARLADPLADPTTLIGNASSRIIYDLHAYYRTRDQPIPAAPVVYTLARERHVHGFDPLELEGFTHAFAWSDGFGREVQRKNRAESGADGLPRWVGSGWTIFNNKGNPVKTYEPFFTSSHTFEFANQVGVASTRCYDPMGRVVATLHPDNTWGKVVFDQWRQETWDVNDTVMIDDPRADPDVGEYFQRILEPGAFTSWRMARHAGLAGVTAAQRVSDRDAADKAEAHANTSTVAHLDARGRLCLSIGNSGGTTRLPVRIAFDAEAKPLATIDPRGRRVTEQCLRESVAGGGFRYVAGYDINGTVLYGNSMDSGERRTLTNILGSPVRSWDAMGRSFRVVSDALQRPIQNWVSTNGGPERLVNRSVYGEAFSNRNLRGQLWRQYDDAGSSSNEAYDFKGNLLASTRHLASDYRVAPDWQRLANLTTEQELDQEATPMLVAADRFVSTTAYDALNRPIQVVTPHSATMRPNVFRLGYNKASLPETVDAWLHQGTSPTGLLDSATADRHPITNVDYNPKGQRTSLSLGNGTITTFGYDRATFRLVHLTTTRPAAVPASERLVQDLHYTFDPTGNVTRIRDEADIQNVIYFRKRRTDPTQDFTYDPLYRLVRSTGREHLGLTGGALRPPQRITNDDLPRTRIPHRGDGNAVAPYTETYEFDDSGNILEMMHQVTSGQWTRTYSYAEPSLVDATQFSNRLSTTNDGAYGYDLHGNMTRMPHLPSLAWDEHDQLRSTSRQIVNAGTPETTWYVYGAGGQRLRKVTDKSASNGAVPTRRHERIYLGPIELWREYNAAGTAITLERETLHISSGSDRVALIETRTVGSDGGSAQLDRYQYGNHLGSAALELDGAAQVITYEEYFPFGSTSYQAVQSQTETPKRYRFTGKERDEESDLSFHGARYYAPWLGRWTACDPTGLADGLNVFAYCSDNPVTLKDPGGTEGKKPVAQIGDMKPHGKQGSAIPGAVKRLSEHEHIRARINIVLQTLDPSTGTSPYTKSAYGKSVTLTIPEDMARAKTKMDLALRDQLKEALKTGVIDDKLIKDMDIESDINRTIAAREQTKTARKAAGQGIDDLNKVTNAGITEAAHLQQSEVFHVGKNQKSPIAGASDADVDNALKDLDTKATKPAETAEKAAVKTETTAVKTEAKALKTEAKALKTGSEALEVAGKSGLKTSAKKLGTKALKVIPFFGIAAGVSSAAYEESQGNHVSAALDTVGLVPVVGDLVDAARLGVALGETADELLGISNVAASHGAAVQGAAKAIGLGEDASLVIGGIGAGVSAITIAPSIAIQNKVAEGISWLLN